MASKAGAKKGIPKPIKRKLDGQAFANRLRAAMATVPGINNTELAKRIGGTKQVVGKWLSGESTNLDALLALKVRDSLQVSLRWLLTGVGSMGADVPITEDEAKLLNVYRLMTDQDMRDFWLAQGKKLLAAQPPTKATAGWPYKPELTHLRDKLRAPPETN